MVCQRPLICNTFRNNVCQMSPFQTHPDSSVSTVIRGAVGIAELVLLTFSCSCYHCNSEICANPFQIFCGSNRARRPLVVSHQLEV